jgi:hypothetical protein
MRILKVIAMAAVMAFAAGVMSGPVGATDARQAIKLCDANPSCGYTVRDNGSVDLVVKNAQGDQYINCPQKGECTCDMCQHPQRTGPKKGLKASVASTLTAGVGTGGPSTGTSAKQAGGWNEGRLKGTFSRQAVASACSKAGGSSWSNLDSYGCTKKNCDGKGGDCSVSCNDKGQCVGQTPPSRVAGATLGQVLGIKVSGGGSPAAEQSQGPRKPSVITGGNILDGSSGFGAQGPAATGSPLGGGAAPAARPGRIN